MTDFSNVTHLLFDHDGVLVDTEYWYFKATQDSSRSDKGVCSRAEGKNLEVAVFEAAAIRLRPILMTSLSTIIGVLPLILGSGPGAASRLTVGITIFGGMLFSTFFTLYVIPTIYTIVGKNTKRIDAVEIDLNKQLKK